MSNLSEAIKKKQVLFDHFKSYLNQPNIPKNSAMSPDYAQSPEDKKPAYIIRWKKTQYAYLFRLSNKFIQFWFKDDSELFINTAQKYVVYLDRQH